MTDWQRLLDRLSDGRWHSAAELYFELNVMVHSRVADLRRRGYVVECERIPGERGARAYRYRLLPKAPDPSVSGSGSGLSLGSCHGRHEQQARITDFEQLAIA